MHAHSPRPDARSLTTALRGRWHGGYGCAPCPVCQTEGRGDQRALSLTDGTDGRLLVRCHKSRCAFSDILASAGVAPGQGAPPDPEVTARREAARQAEADKRSRRARALWDEAQPIAGTPAEAYLRGRAIACPLPDTLRFHPEAWHKPSARRLPVMLARVDGAEGFAIHRTYLTAQGRKADVEGAKLSLGSIRGGAVHVVPWPQDGTRRLTVAEGIETALSLACGLLRRPAAVWAGLSATGMAGLRLPGGPGALTVAPDGDDAGRTAADTLAGRAHALGWAVSLLPAPQGWDWNDVLRRADA